MDATGFLNLDDALLVIVDVQGKLARLMDESEAMIRQQQVLIAGCRLLDVPIVWAEQLPEKLGATVPELAEKLAGLDALSKSSFGCCGDDVLMSAIKASGRRQVALCGIEAHVCVWQTAAELIRLGYEVHLVCDAVSARSSFSRDIALRRMSQAGVRLSTVEMILFELMQNAEHPRFREVTALLK